MIIMFIVIANEVLKCYVSVEVGFRFCESGSAVELTRLWQLGLVEVGFEGVLGGIAMKIWRRISDKSRGVRKDRLDKKV
jgi:hypothetical protein